MNRPTFIHLARPAFLALLLTTVLLLGAGPSAWARPGQTPAGQSVPTMTPGGPAIPQVTPPPIGRLSSMQQLVGPGMATTITSSAGVVKLPNNAVSAPGTMEVVPVAVDQLPPANNGYALFGQPMEIVLFDASGRLAGQTSFANPIQVCLDYSADDLARVGGQAGHLVVQLYDISTQKWVSLPTTPDAAGGSACGTTNQLGWVALAARSSTPDVLPQTGLAPSERGPQQPGPATSNLALLVSNPGFWWIIVALAAAMTAMLVLAFRLGRTRGTKA